MENPSEMMTIKAFAAASGRSQQAIYKQIETRLAPYLHIIEGQKYIERRALGEVFGVGGVKPIQSEKREKNDGLQHELRAEIAFLRSQLEAKDKQLETKDKQLEAKDRQIQDQSEQIKKKEDEILNLTAAVENMSKNVGGAQALHAGTMQQLGAGEPAHGEEVAIDAEPVDPPAEQPAARPATDLRFRDRLRYLITGKL